MSSISPKKRNAPTDFRTLAYITTTRTITYILRLRSGLAYDPLGRLTDADYSTGESYVYAYDEVGNRTAYTATLESTTVTTYTYDAANRLTAVGDVAYTWDDRGNLTHDGVFTYTYNAAGRLVRAESVTNTLVYTYTAAGLRVAQSVDGDEATYAWDWASGLPEMLSEGGNLYLAGHETLGKWDGDEWAYYLPDALGSVRQVTDETGAVTAAREWTPYGVELALSGVEGVGGAQAGLGYTGEWGDAALGMTYLRARWYDSYLNQFVSPDPIVPDYRNPQSINRFAYAFGNPIRYTDQSGLSPTVDCSIWPNYLGFLPLKDLCEVANDPYDGPDALDAREEIFRIIVSQGRNFSLIGGHGYRQAADMLEHFLDGGGAKLYISAPWDFVFDPGISRATHGLVGWHRSVTPDSFWNAQIPSDEPDWIMPLLWVFMQEHVQPHARQGKSTVMPVSLIGTDYYSDDLPRPYNTGYWAAFGHVGLEHTGGIVGMLSGEVSPDCSSDGYFLQYLAHYHVEDRYQWFEGKQTPMSFPGTSGVYIPHEWEISLAEASECVKHFWTTLTGY